MTVTRAEVGAFSGMDPFSSTIIAAAARSVQGAIGAPHPD